MKIAVASDDTKNIAPHVGRCRYFLVYDVEGKNIKNVEILENSFGGHHNGRCYGETEHHGKGSGHHEHKSMIDALRNCNVIISGGMGLKLHDDLAANGITAITTGEKNAESAVKMFLKGILRSETKRICGCQHH
ncbi:MAG: NifB/NifX family molybdenum-iron cluster-binding protein [bacterium]